MLVRKNTHPKPSASSCRLCGSFPRLLYLSGLLPGKLTFLGQITNRINLNQINTFGSTFSIFRSRLFLNNRPEAFSAITCQKDISLSSNSSAGIIM